MKLSKIDNKIDFIYYKNWAGREVEALGSTLRRGTLY